MKFFARCTGKKRHELEEVMNRDTWFSAQEAIDFGLADSIVGMKHEYKYEIDEDDYPKSDLRGYLNRWK